MCYNEFNKEKVWVNNMGEYIGIILIVLLIFAVFGIIFMYRSSSKNMMKSLLKQQKDLLSDKEGTLEELASTALKAKKKILENNAEDIAYINQKEAELKSAGIRTTAKAMKEGFTDSDSVYCKHCGTSIDSDSKFCKKCGKEQ